MSAAEPSPEAPKTPVDLEKKAPPVERLVVTEHKLVVGQRTLEYTATCG